ncbi:hypothetical protein [Rhodococcus sp. KRD197]|uniref:hypothetical protein n=1 Tax=Rhodococcus sp. KRD197 TaxID=2729731 RepID=UPI0019D27F9E|nr:hypothetical protein [Rhodococcus sp. KRD197]
MTETTMSGTLKSFYSGKATELGLALEDDDLAILEQITGTADVIAELQLDIETNGAVQKTQAGSTKVNPAAAELRQQRLALTRLQATLDHRIDKAAGQLRAGGSGGLRPVRGTYGTNAPGETSENKTRNETRQRGSRGRRHG